MIHLDTYEDFKINEEVSVQPLYHYTTLSNLYLILKTNKLIARHVGDGSRYQWRKISKKSISFCRKYLNLDQLRGIQDGVAEPIRIVIHFDYEKLKQKYKFVPWSDSRSKSPEVNTSQFEERCTSDILDVKQYITRIQVIFNEVISGMRFNETSLKNDDIGFGSGKDESYSNLPYDEFIKSEFFKKTLYDILSLDKSLKKDFSQIYNLIIEETGRGKKGNIITNSKLMICLWIWWLFNRTRKLASGITFDFKDLYNLEKKNVLNTVKLNSSKSDLIKSLFSIKDILLKDLKENYDDQLKQISSSVEGEKRRQKLTELEKEQEHEKENQKRRDKENVESWRKQKEKRLENEREISDKKIRKERVRVKTKLREELSTDENYIVIVKWVESNLSTTLSDKSNPREYLNYLKVSIYDIDDDSVRSSVYDNLDKIVSLIDNCEYSVIKKTIEECKELLLSIKKSLVTFKPSTFKKLKRFLGI